MNLASSTREFRITGSSHIEGSIPNDFTKLKQLSHRISQSEAYASKQLEAIAQAFGFKTKHVENTVALAKITPKFGYSLTFDDDRFSFTMQADSDLLFVLKKAALFLTGELRALEAGLSAEDLGVTRNAPSAMYV